MVKYKGQPRPAIENILMNSKTLKCDMVFDSGCKQLIKEFSRGSFYFVIVELFFGCFQNQNILPTDATDSWNLFALIPMHGCRKNRNLRVQGRSLEDSLGADESRGSDCRGRSQEESGCNRCVLHCEGYG
jgi:hypothetical protein